MLAVISPLTPKLSGAWPLVFLGTAASFGVFGLTMLFVRWEGLRLRDVGAAPGLRSLLRFVVGFVTGLLLVALSAAIQTVVGHLRWVRTPGVGLGSVIITILGFTALASREELAFRGYPLRRLERSFGVWGAQFIVAAVFALEHWVGGWSLSRAILGAGVGSLVFGMAAIATRGLALPIGLHAAWNFGDSMIGQNYSAGFWKAIVENGQAERFQSLITISYLIVMGLALLGFCVWHRQVNRIQFEA
ncbi:MAG TPA: type II CAAX endopeptidase family protein [Tepidisphaeraceae bacterium]|jgi:hypothetical protein